MEGNMRMEGSIRKLWGYVLLVTAFLACPCHLPVTLPLLLAVLGGTSLGAFLARHPEFVGLAMLVYFVVALAAGWALLHRHEETAQAAAYGDGVAQEEACSCCSPGVPVAHPDQAVQGRVTRR
jgi:mercuric ion transport protein